MLSIVQQYIDQATKQGENTITNYEENERFIFTARQNEDSSEAQLNQGDTKRAAGHSQPHTSNQLQCHLSLIQIIERSDEEQNGYLIHKHQNNDSGDDQDILKFDLTNGVVLKYIGNHTFDNKDTEYTSTSCTSTHDTDSTYESVINMFVFMPDITHNSAKWKSRYIINQSSSGIIENISID